MKVEGLEGKRVLVVEDEMLVCMDIEDMLAEFGCIVVGPAPSVDRAMKVIAMEQFDVAMLDLNLAGKPSYPIADHLAENNIPFMLASGYADVRPDHADRPRLQKPFMKSELRDKLLETIQGVM
ncbi:response regulator [Loktanella sp. DJP18]|uniref:response regulator n=1 Tax=Loktanella sp. DJP18 TaxID=3409788 RepID=UPI003BB4F6D1